ncbi:hypothetical protein DRJ48_02465 [Candidatus Woesearchaeota archaeon]|nr:hypothetical protein [Candidatus Woesearchaeota archaeon]RLE42884.1 MAG: hypothetical protein DRJ48_02465 [Candidatus Woesearchaeota archaeon]
MRLPKYFDRAYAVQRLERKGFEMVARSDVGVLYRRDGKLVAIPYAPEPSEGLELIVAKVTDECEGFSDEMLLNAMFRKQRKERLLDKLSIGSTLLGAAIIGGGVYLAGLYEAESTRCLVGALALTGYIPFWLGFTGLFNINRESYTRPYMNLVYGRTAIKVFKRM